MQMLERTLVQHLYSTYKRKTIILEIIFGKDIYQHYIQNRRRTISMVKAIYNQLHSAVLSAWRSSPTSYTCIFIR